MGTTGMMRNVKTKKETSAATWHGVVFVFLIAQQIVAFVFDPFKFVAPYWILVTLFTLFLFFRLKIKINVENRKPFILFVLCSLGALANTVLGTPFGYGLSICYYSFLAFTGLNYVTKYRINTFVFIPFFIILYVFFYYKYFIFDEVTRMAIDNDLFVQASANAIAMSLNMVFIIYWMVSQRQSENHKCFFLSIAMINLILIVIQGSRAGILVAFILVVFSIINAFGSGLNIKVRFRFLIPVIAICVIFYYFRDYILEFLVIRKMESQVLFDDNNVRYFAQLSFFQNLDVKHFLFGYPKDYQFVPDITRTYNAFLDLWSRCGFASFLYLLFCLVDRIKNHKRYDVPVLLLIPFLAYAPFESLWGGTLWDICLYICIFYSYSGKNTFGGKGVLIERTI